MSLPKHLNRFFQFLDFFKTNTSEYCAHLEANYLSEINTSSIFGVIVQEECVYYY